MWDTIGELWIQTRMANTFGYNILCVLTLVARKLQVVYGRFTYWMTALLRGCLFSVLELDSRYKCRVTHTPLHTDECAHSSVRKRSVRSRCGTMESLYFFPMKHAYSYVLFLQWKRKPRPQKTPSGLITKGNCYVHRSVEVKGHLPHVHARVTVWTSFSQLLLLTHQAGDEACTDFTRISRCESWWR